MRRPVTAVAALIVAHAAAAAQHAEHHSEKLGTVQFETSCSPKVSAQFNRAVALLHSFEFGASMRAFDQVIAADSGCAMAYWGLALNLWTNPMVPDVRGRAALESARRVIATGTSKAQGATPRERAYLGAVAELFTDHERRPQQERILAYERAMAGLVAAHPSDTEAKIFHALALAASASPADKTYARQLRAGAILEELFARQPDHPGLAHYIIHSYDYPALSARAEAAAKRYAEIAPSAAHALHMPSHTFTRVGLWRESAATNLRSREAAKRDSSLAEAFHATDYAVYAYLQMRRDSAARALLDEIPPLAARFDPTKITGAAPGSAGVYALAAMPARYALERRAWAEAAALPFHPSDFPFADAVTWFARSIGAARSGSATLARHAIDTLEALRARSAATGETYWTEQIVIQQLAARGLLAHALGQHAESVRLLREAALREDATEKAAVTPGPIAPARELLADVLLALGRREEALAEYRATLEREHNRYRALDGARAAAAAAGDSAAAAEFARRIARLTAHAP